MFVFFHQFFRVWKQQFDKSEDLLFSFWDVLSMNNLNVLNIKGCVQVYKHWALLGEDRHRDREKVRKLSNAIASHEMKEGFSKLGSFADFQKLLSTKNPGQAQWKEGVTEGFWETVFLCQLWLLPRLHPLAGQKWDLISVENTKKNAFAQYAFPPKILVSTPVVPGNYKNLTKTYKNRCQSTHTQANRVDFYLSNLRTLSA